MKNKNSKTEKQPMGKGFRKALAVYAVLVLMLTVFSTTAFAADDPLQVVNNLSEFIFGLIRAAYTAGLRHCADWTFA